jgi:hypothetical protein
MKQLEWDEISPGRNEIKWNMIEAEWNRQNEECSWNETELNKKEAEWNRNEAEWSRMKQFFRENETKNENFDEMKQKWGKIRNETKSVSFISGSWTRHPTVITVNASCKWQLLVI